MSDSPTLRKAGTVLVAAAILLSACAGDAEGTSGADVETSTTVASPPSIDEDAGTVEAFRVEVLETFGHDPSSYTQGLVYAEPDRVYETSGLYGESELREVALSTGRIIQNRAFDDAQFGEGLEISNGRLIALTWKEQTALAFDPATFEPTGSYTYETEGWGLCDDGNRLVMSDGSDQLTFRNRDTFEATGSVQVTLDGRPQASLNELECVDGLVYANVYLTDQIVMIDPSSGHVVGVVDAAGLLDETERERLDHGEVLNGIAYDTDRGTFYLTGKNWPELFEVVIKPA